MSARRRSALPCLALVAIGCVATSKYNRAHITVVDGEPVRDRAVVEGVVIDRKTGEPAADAIVFVSCDCAVDRLLVKTPASGRFHFEYYPRDRHAIDIWISHEYDRMSRSVEVAPGRRIHVRFEIHPDPWFKPRES